MGDWKARDDAILAKQPFVAMQMSLSSAQYGGHSPISYSNAEEIKMLEALKMTPFGVLHTVISLIAVVAGFTVLVHHRRITPKVLAGKIYVVATILTCITGLGIFHHGGFGKPHVLAIITLIVIGVALIAGRTSLFGRASRYVEAVAYSMTLFFHMIPAVNETATRLPLGAPLAASPESPGLQAAVGILFIVFLVGAFLQVRWLRTTNRERALDVRLNGHRQLSRASNAG